MFEKYFNKRRQQLGTEIEEITENPPELDETHAIGSEISKNRIKFVRLVVFLVFFLLISRVFYLQVVKGDYYGEMARENRVREIIIKAPRGFILDRNGRKLVNNIPSFDLVAIPADIPRDQGAKKEKISEIARIFSMNDQSIGVIIDSQDSNSMNPVLIRENITEEEALMFSEKKSALKGFSLDQTAVRQYEDGRYFSSIIGYNGKITKEEIGKDPDNLF